MEITAVGQTITWTTWVGAKMHQDRPSTCRYYGCKCEKNCDGTPVTHTGTVAEIVAYADNSRTAYVQDETGYHHPFMLTAPNGDRS